MANEDERLPLSALQHLLYCPRQCALIHIERLWEENLFTAEGRILHDRTHRPGTEVQHGLKVARSMQVWSDRLGVFGICDVVEFREGVPTPVEYKRGKPKAHRADDVQVCAQAMCIEDMLDVRIPQADLFYGQTRRRHTVSFDAELRQLVRDVAQRCHELVDAGHTPPARYERRKCSACSLMSACLPRVRSGEATIPAYLGEALTELPLSHATNSGGAQA